MKVRSKLISSCIALLLTLGLLVVGVLAATSATVNFNGSVSFVADDVYAKVNGEISGTLESGDATKLDELYYSAYDYPEEELESWESIKDFTFKDKNSTIKVDIVIENLSTERPLFVKVTGSVGTKDNVTQAVKHNDGGYTVGEVIPLEPKTGDESVTTKFSILLNIEDYNYAVNKVDFAYVIELNNEDTSAKTEQYSVGFDFISETIQYSALTPTSAPLAGKNKYEITADEMPVAYIDSGEYDILSKLDSGTNLTILIYISDFSSMVNSITVDGVAITGVSDGENSVYTINKTLTKDLTITIDGDLGGIMI